jgi:hypothetical protein
MRKAGKQESFFLPSCFPYEKPDRSIFVFQKLAAAAILL